MSDTNMSSRSSYSASGSSKTAKDLRNYFINEEDSCPENDDDKCNSESRLKVEHVHTLLDGFLEYKKFMLYMGNQIWWISQVAKTQKGWSEVEYISCKCNRCEGTVPESTSR